MMLYFGIIDGRGHDMWTDETEIALPMFCENGSRWRVGKAVVELPWAMVDCVLCPGERVARRCDDLGDVVPENQREGEYALHHVDGWTALAWWDRSGRSGFWSNSVLFAKGTLTAAEILAMAHERFPSVMRRVSYTFVEGKHHEVNGLFSEPEFGRVDAVGLAAQNRMKAKGGSARGPDMIRRIERRRMKRRVLDSAQ